MANPERPEGSGLPRCFIPPRGIPLATCQELAGIFEPLTPGISASESMYRQIFFIVLLVSGSMFSLSWQQTGNAQVQDRPLTAPPQRGAEQQEGEEQGLLTRDDPTQDLDFVIQFQNSLIDQELNKAFQCLELNDPKLKTRIKESLRDQLGASAKKAMESGATMSFSQRFNDDLLEALIAECKKRIPEEKQEQLVVFFDREKAFRKLEDANGLGSLISYLDTQLCLSKKQRKQLRELIQREWQPGYNDLAGSVLLSGMGNATNLIEALNDEEVKAVLEQAQYEYFLKLNQQMLVTQQLLTPSQGGERSYDAVEKQFESALNLVRLDYERILGELSESQLKMLNVAGKGAVSKIVGEWKVAVEKNDNAEVPRINSELAGRVFEPMASQCVRHATWKKTLSKVFSMEELEEINVVETARSQNAKRELVTYLALILVKQTPGISISVEQHQKLCDLMMEDCAVDGRFNFNSIMLEFLSIEDEKFQEIFSVEQWPMFEQLLSQGRANKERVEAMEREEQSNGADDQ